MRSPLLGGCQSIPAPGPIQCARLILVSALLSVGVLSLTGPVWSWSASLIPIRLTAAHRCRHGPGEVNLGQVVGLPPSMCFPLYTWFAFSDMGPGGVRGALGSGLGGLDEWVFSIRSFGDLWLLLCIGDGVGRFRGVGGLLLGGHRVWSDSISVTWSRARFLGSIKMPR